MYHNLQQFVGGPVDILYMNDEKELLQRRIDILTTGERCTYAYCFRKKAPKLFRNENILAVMHHKQAAGH